MLNFEYYAPTKVIFGKATETVVGQEIKKYGGKRVLIHYGGESARRSGLLDRVEESLRQADIAFATLSGVKPNPRLSKVREGIELAKRENIDFLLAVGGGSVIDSAKAIAYAMANPEHDIWDFFDGKAAPSACLPVGVVLTIAASGSEMSNSCVITKEEGGMKRSLNTDLARPRFAIMNPELTFTLPPYQTAAGSVDIMMHTQERYFANEKNNELIDRIAEGLMVTVLHNAPIVMKDPTDYNARAELMWAGSLSHNGLTGTGRLGDFACHKMEHEIGGMFDVIHGAGLAAIWGSWARYVCKHDIGRFAQFAVRVMGCPMDYDNPENTALAGIEALENFYRRLDMPTNLRELGLADVTDAQIHEMAEKCTNGGKNRIGNFVPLGESDIEKIFKMAR